MTEREVLLGVGIIVFGVAIIVAGAAVMADLQVLFGAAVIGLGVADIVLGAAIIGPATVVSGIRRLVDGATKAPQSNRGPSNGKADDDREEQNRVEE